MSNPPVYLGAFDPFYSPQAIDGSPANLPPLTEQVRRSYLPLSSAQPMFGDPLGSFEAGNVAQNPVNFPSFNLTFPDNLRTSDTHRYAFSVVDISLAVSNTTSIKIIDQPAGKRNLLVFRNASAAANIFIGYGKDATTLSTLALVPGQLVAFDTVVPQDDVYVIADAVNAVICYSYSNISANNT